MENQTDALISELDAFMAEYDKRTNAHDVNRWRELVADDAIYWSTDGSFAGIDAITDAVQRTFDEIQDEVYTISDLHWVCASSDCAVVRYRFHWVGYTNGERREGQGRGTNAVVQRNGRWQMIHEHLSV